MLGPSEHVCRPSNLHDTLEEDHEIIIKAGGGPNMNMGRQEVMPVCFVNVPTSQFHVGVLPSLSSRYHDVAPAPYTTQLGISGKNSFSTVIEMLVTDVMTKLTPSVLRTTCSLETATFLAWICLDLNTRGK